MSGLSLETCTSNLKSVALTVLELLAFNAQKFRGSRDSGHVPLQKIFKGSCPDCLLNLTSVALTVLELFLFNAHLNWSD